MEFTRDELITAARIANPWVRIDLGAVSADRLVTAARILTAQKVSLMAVADRYGADVPGDNEALGRLVRADREKFRTLRDEFESIRHDFARRGIATILLKSTGLYPSFSYLSSNLDVLVAPEHADTARRILVERGYVELLNVEEPGKFLFRRFTGDGRSFTFHMHEQVGWGVPFVAAASMWRNARPSPDDPAIHIPGPVEALLVTTAHWFYEDKSLSLGNLIATACALKNLDDPLEVPAEAASGSGWEEGYWAALGIFDRSWEKLYGERFLDGERFRSLDRALGKHHLAKRRLLPRVSYLSGEVASIPFVLNKVFYYRKVLRDPGRRRRTRIRDAAVTLLWAVRWKLHVRSHKPLLVTVSGCDGSGKTLQARGLEVTFGTCDVRTRVVWARGASSRFMGLFIKTAKKLRDAAGGRKDGGVEAARPGGAHTEAQKMAGRRRALANPFLRFLFSALYACDLGWIYCWKIRALKAMGYVVITDRYVYDGLVDFSLMSGRPVDHPPAALRWLLRSAPRPDVGVVLDVEPSEALRRKPEEGGTRFLDEARRAFLKLSASENLELVPAGGTPEDIQRSLALASLRKFYGRYRTFLNGLLCSNPHQLNPPRRKE